MRVRHVVKGDVREILALSAAHVEEVFPHLSFDHAHAEANFHALVGSPEVGAFCVERDEKLIGWVCGTRSTYRFCSGIYAELEVLYVQPENRGSRAAALLVTSFLDWAERSGATDIFLSASNPKTAPRVGRMFQKFGAEHVGYVFVKR